MEPFSVVIPACNEAGAIGSVIQDVRSLGLNADIVVVDDGSTDNTGEIARSSGARVITHRITLGAGRSVKDGIDAAYHERIVMIDGDSTYPVNKIPLLLEKLDGGFDLVVGARRGKEYRGSIFKILARFAYKMIAQFATGKRIPDINSGMRAFHKTVMQKYFMHLCNGFSLPTTMTLAYFFTGRTVTYVPIEYFKRIGHSKVRIFVDSLRALQYITESIVYFNPLKLFLLLCIVVLIAGGIGMIFVGPMSLILGFFASVIVFALGLVTESMRRPRH